MIINKKYVGKSNTQTGEIHYYLIQKDSQYGIELMEVDQEEMTSSLEWISENQEETRSFVEMLCRHGASPIHLSEMIDDFIN